MTPYLLDHLPGQAAAATPTAIAVVDGNGEIGYAALDAAISACANGLLQLGLQRGERVAVYLDKRIENVIACFGAARAGLVFVPVNPLLKPAQVAHILNDCSVRALVTAPERHALLADTLAAGPSVQHCICTGTAPAGTLPWQTLLAAPPATPHRIIDSDLAAIFYTSGSTGKAKGVMLSHRNLVCGAHSVAGYLGNHADDRLVAALPLSFDAGFSQLTTAFSVGACVVLHNYLLPQDLLKLMARERITGLTAVPPLYMQLVQQAQWPEGIAAQLRYFANTGGRMPQATLQALRQRLPASRPFLMYGLTEAFRSTYLPPAEIERRPDSIGKAIPNAEVLVLRSNGSECAADEPGELVHRGPLVSLGYWSDPSTTALRFKPLPRVAGHSRDEIAVFSGDIVRRDAEGYLYFIGRNDEMIKTSGYRVSPTEVEEVVHASGLVSECCAFGIDDAQLGQRIHLAVVPVSSDHFEHTTLIAHCRAQLPTYMLPANITVHTSLPRNSNGKIDRKQVASEVTV